MSRKIIDCFTFFNELDLLEIRLKYLYDIVDYFVIVEADTTFTGNKKQFNFKNHKERFTQFLDKIIYVPVPMGSFNEGYQSAWDREAFQRNSISIGLEKSELAPHDLVLISDLDEFPNAKILTTIKKKGRNALENYTILSHVQIFLVILKFSLKRAKFKIRGNNKYKSELRFLTFGLKNNRTSPLNFNLSNYYYYLNYKAKDVIWPGIQCVEFSWLTEFTINEFRSFRFTPLASINNGGWHFSYLGGKEIIKYKLKNFSHQEYNIPKIVSDEYIDFCINNGYSLFDYYRNPAAKPIYEKKEITCFPEELQKIVTPYKNLILA